MDNKFFSSERVSLKVCGVKKASDALKLATMGVDAIGVNFWSKSKRYCSPEDAFFLQDFKERVTRIGVFVNAEFSLPERLYKEGYIDIVQLHGDENEEYCAYFVERGIPFIKAIGLRNDSSIKECEPAGAMAILVDAYAPGVYGGTGERCDWNSVSRLKERFTNLPIILAGGIKPENVSEARLVEGICALDVASGVEFEPGVIDFEKVRAMLID